VEEDAVFRHVQDFILKLGDIGRLVDHHSVAVAEDEIAKAEVVNHIVAQISKQMLGVLVQKAHAQLGSFGGVFVLGTLQDHRQLGIVLFDAGDQLDTGDGVHLFPDLVAHVRDHAEQVLAVFLIEPHRFVIIVGQQHLGPDSHPEPLVDVTHLLLDQLLRLLHDHAVEGWQEKGIIVDAVFHQQDHAHQAVGGVKLHVEVVLDIFDHRQKQLGIAVPEEDGVDILLFLGVIFPDDIVRSHVQQQQDGQVRLGFFDLFGQLKGADLAYPHHRDHQVIAAFLELFQRVRPGGNAGDARRGGEIELAVFSKDLLRKTAILFKDKGVVKSGHQQDVAHPALHQLMEYVLAKLELIIIVVQLFHFHKHGPRHIKLFFWHRSGFGDLCQQKS